GPAKQELLQLAVLGGEHIRPGLGTVRSAVKVIEAEFETRSALPHPAERMILADDQPAIGLQDAGGFPVTARQVGDPYRDMAAGIDEIVACVSEARQVDDIGPHELHLQPDRRSTAPRDLELWLGGVDPGHPG